MNFPPTALHVPTILLPAPSVDLTTWAVVACDQYTSQPEYWREVREIVGDAPSTLNLILPEAYLGDQAREATATQRIADTMHAYVTDGVLVAEPPGFILTERWTHRPQPRHGLIVALDLEAYDFAAGSTTLIRASEGTVVERLPPRARIRERAPIEIPHVMVLIDDPECTVIEPLFQEDLEQAYDAKLMHDGGTVRGWRVQQERLIRKVAINLARLASAEVFANRYGVADRPVLLYALGDGNHSFAAAKLAWERIKQSAGDRAAIAGHPARYALVELVNVHDQGLGFEPIHRLLIGVDRAEIFTDMQTFFSRRGSSCSCRMVESAEAMTQATVAAGTRGAHRIGFVAGDDCGIVSIDNPRCALPTGSLQSFLNAREAEGRPLRVDYIHGDDTLRELARAKGCIGFFLPTLSKHDLFRTVILDGVLPRKTFSMGEADEKRFYLECRRIVP